MQDHSFHTSLLGRETARMEAAAVGYYAFHEARFAYAVTRCRAICPDRAAAVLDVGRGALSLELLRVYDHVTTLGFPLQPHDVESIDVAGVRRVLRGHIDYNLNEAQHAPPRYDGAGFDLIVFAEVIEHLYTAPELTLHALRKLMKPGGHLVIQMPNAAALHKRWALLVGRNPYERIRINPCNPGHFREYTKAELYELARQLDFEVVSHAFRDYFAWDRVPGGRFTCFAFKVLVAVMPSLARGQTIVLRQTSTADRSAKTDDSMPDGLVSANAVCLRAGAGSESM